VVAQPGWPIPTGRSVLVNAGLTQDVFLVPSPNRTFWTIAIEAQLYVLFPLLILLARRVHPAAMLAAVCVPVLTLGALAQRGDAYAAHLVSQYTPDLAVLFAIGAAAAGVLPNAARAARPWGLYTVLLAVPPATLVAVAGSTWTIDHFFWVDMTLGPAIACLLIAAATRRARLVWWVLDSRPVRRLGTFSYSLYLTHGPILIALYYGWLRVRVDPGVPTFLVLSVLGIPITVAFAAVFAAVFELPFQRHRSLAAPRQQRERISGRVRGLLR
jgi:peptidoglycan/LPS O-acetylase OafA/YrhL